VDAAYPPDRGMSMLSFQPCTCVSLKSAPARSRSSGCTCSTMGAHKVVIDSHLSKLGSMPHRKGLESRADYPHKEPTSNRKSDRSRISQIHQSLGRQPPPSSPAPTSPAILLLLLLLVRVSLSIWPFDLKRDGHECWQKKRST
jgi:hypothetical protein